MFFKYNHGGKMKFFPRLTLLLFAGLCWISPENYLLSFPAEPNDAPQPSLGKTIFDARCTPCHGINGKGDGAASALLNPRPRNFTSGMFKFRSTESGSLPTDDDLTSTVKNGLHGTAMPDWAPFITGDSLKAVVDYVKTFSARFQNEKPHPVHVSSSIPSSAASIAAGKNVYAKLQCADCHGTDGAGAGVIAKDFKDNWDFETNAVNLTEPWTFRGGSLARDVYLRFRTGVDGTPMPSYVGTVSEKEMWDLANYVVSLGRKPVWKMNEAEIKDLYAKLDKHAKADPVQRGKYLVRSIGCAGCHSMYTDDLRTKEGSQLSGGLTFDLYPFGKFTTRNLTSDKETGLGNWTDQEIKRAFTQGINRQGRRFLPFPMPWTAFATLTVDDQNAIVAYLRTVPAVHHKIPDPDKPNIFAYLWGKFKMLILKQQLPTPVAPMKESADEQKSVTHNFSGASKNFAVRAEQGKEVRP
jgi:cytochrome c oxidase cbb3-type subunit 2